MYARLVNRFSATRPGSWLVKHVAARIDPVIFRWSNGRFTSTGAPTLDMLTLTVPGRRSGELRSVQLAYEPDGDDYLVVASAMGQERHPAWRYNLEAADSAMIRLRGRELEVTATVLSDEEKPPCGTGCAEPSHRWPPTSSAPTATSGCSDSPRSSREHRPADPPDRPVPLTRPADPPNWAAGPAPLLPLGSFRRTIAHSGRQQHRRRTPLPPRTDQGSAQVGHLRAGVPFHFRRRAVGWWLDPAAGDEQGGGSTMIDVVTRSLRSAAASSGWASTE